MADPVSNLQRNRIHRALSRPNLLTGADRELALITGLAAIILIFVVLTIYSALFGIAVWIVVVAALRMMARADPMMRRVYIRHISYRSTHRAASETAWGRAADQTLGRPIQHYVEDRNALAKLGQGALEGDGRIDGELNRYVLTARRKSGRKAKILAADVVS